MIFLSTLSLRRATKASRAATTSVAISIHALLAESDAWSQAQARPQSCISIHALLAESDATLDAGGNDLRNFYPRSPCGERPVSPDSGYDGLSISIHALLAESDDAAITAQSPRRVFLSTLSLRRATRVRYGPHRDGTYFYPRSPCGERPCQFGAGGDHATISIHALLAESDNYLLQS